METKYIPIDRIEARSNTQVRVRLEPAAIDDYAQSMLDNAIMPPLVVFAENGSSRFVLADGFHRLAAARKAKLIEIECQVREGTPTDALTFALGANCDHGLRRTNADKRNAVLMALKTPEYDRMLVRDMADMCGVSHALVANIKQEINEAALAKAAKKNGKGKGDLETVSKNIQTPIKTDPAIVPRTELMEAMKVVRAFPYNGEVAVEKMRLTKEYIHDLEYVFDWLSEVLDKLDGEGT